MITKERAQELFELWQESSCYGFTFSAWLESEGFLDRDIDTITYFVQTADKESFL